MTSIRTEVAHTDDLAAAEEKAREREIERQLVQRAVDKDCAAFADLYDKHVVRVYRHIYYMVNDAREAEDLTAQTFLKAWEAVGRYKERGAPFVAWLLRIAHNLTVSHLRPSETTAPWKMSTSTTRWTATLSRPWSSRLTKRVCAKPSCSSAMSSAA